MSRPAAGTPPKFRKKTKRRAKIQRNLFAVKIPQINEVFEATKLEGEIAPLVKQLIVIRIFRGITRKDMATACGVRTSSITNIETGVKLPTLGLLLRMAFVVGAKIELTGWMDTPVKEIERKDEEE